MENKKAQALDDDLLENIIGGISLRGVFDAEARIPIRGRHNLRYAIEKPWVEQNPGLFYCRWLGLVRCRGIFT